MIIKPLMSEFGGKKSRAGEINVAKRKTRNFGGNDVCMQKKINNQIYMYLLFIYTPLYIKKKAHENERRVIDNDADDEENAIAATNIGSAASEAAATAVATTTSTTKQQTWQFK